MNHSTIEIVENGRNDGKIFEVQHYGPWPEEWRVAQLLKPNLSYWLMKEPACAMLEIENDIEIRHITYINSGRMVNGRWIFIRRQT